MLYALPLCDLYIMSFDSPKKQKTVKDGPLEKWSGGVGGGGWGSFSLHEFFFSKVTLTEKFTCRPCERMVEFLPSF